MRLNPFRRAPKPGPVLLQITPPRTGERTLLGIENLLQAIATDEPFALELAADSGGVRLMIRTKQPDLVRGQIASHYPQARVETIEEPADPAQIREGEQAWTTRLRSSGPEFLPLRVFRDRDLLDPGSDPLLAPLGALSGLAKGERVITRLRMQPLGPDWSRHHQALLDDAPPKPTPPGQSHQPKTATDPLALTVLALVGFAAFRGYSWLQAGEIWNLVALCAGAAVALIGGGWLWRKWKSRRRRVWDLTLIKEKISRVAFQGDLELIAVLPEGSQESRGAKLLDGLALAYRHYDHPAGARFESGTVRQAETLTPLLAPANEGLFGKRSVFGVREVASL